MSVVHQNVTRPPFVGPHEGDELTLMMSGSKPMAMFVEPLDTEFEYFPETDFDEQVQNGRFVKCECIGETMKPDGKVEKFRRILYCNSDETWRLRSMILIQDLYQSLMPGWRPDLDRVIGILLGYKRDDIERFLAWMAERNSPAG